MQREDEVDFHRAPEFYSNFEFKAMSYRLNEPVKRGYYPQGVPEMLALSAVDEKALFESYARKRTAKTREKLVRRYICWAYKMATKLCGPRLEIDDAISAANVGLMEALETFDASKGSKFTTHSYFVIRRHLIEALVGTYPVHVSQHIRKKMKMQPISSIETEEDEAPKSLDELFERLGAQTDFQMAEMYERPEDCTSISPSALSAEEELGRTQTLDKIRVFINNELTPLERKVFVGRHYKDPQVSFETLCKRLKTTKFAVREAYRTALEKVQAEFKP